MDFLFVTGPGHRDFPSESIAALGAWPAFTVRLRADGFLAWTSSAYPGLDPFVAEDETVTLVLGDPLFSWVTGGGSGTSASARTGQVAGRLASERLEDEAFRAFHSATIIRIPPVTPAPATSETLCEIRQDALGGIPVFVLRRGNDVAISSSPDLIALATGATLDLVSCQELAACSRVTFPYTLYEGIEELAPNAVHRFARSAALGEVQLREVPIGLSDPFAGSTLRLEGAQSALQHHFDDFFARMDSNLPSGYPVTSTLSAGVDSRTITAAARAPFGRRLSALTASPATNADLRVARRVAKRLRIPQTELRWDPGVFASRFIEGRALLVGSHRRWTDAHFLGSMTSLGGRAGLGGFYSGPLFDGRGGLLNARTAAIGAGMIPHNSPAFVVSPHFYALENDTREAILARNASAQPLTDSYRIDSMQFSFPSGRALESAHDAALQRGWAHYEPLPTENALSLVRAAAALRPAGLKDPIYAQILQNARVDRLPVNPDQPGTGAGSWLSFGRVLAAHSEFATEFARISSVANEIVRVPPRAVRQRSTFANVYWAHLITSEPGPPA